MLLSAFLMISGVYGSATDACVNSLIKYPMSYSKLDASDIGISINQVSIGSDGSIYAINSATENEKVYKYSIDAQNDYSLFGQVDGALVQISLGESDGPDDVFNVWGVSPDYTLYKLDETVSEWTKLGGSGWKQVSVASDGSTYGISYAGFTYRFFGDRYYTIDQQNFNHISVGDSQNIYSVDTKGNVYKLDLSQTPFEQSHQRLSGHWNAIGDTTLVTIEATSGGDLFGIDSDGHIYRYYKDTDSFIKECGIKMSSFDAEGGRFVGINENGIHVIDY